MDKQINLKVTHYRNGDPIQLVTDSKEWINLTTGAYQITPEGHYLYNHFAVTDERGLAPEGYYIPNKKQLKKIKKKNVIFAGYISGFNGTLTLQGIFGYYWSSTINGTNASYRYFNSTLTSSNSDYRTYGFSVMAFREKNKQKTKKTNEKTD